MTNSQTSSTPRISYPFAKLDRGDVVWAKVGYQNDIENDERTIVGRRPCVIVSTKRYHKNFGTVIAVPISHSNHFPKVDVELTSVPELDGYAKPYQQKNLDICRRGYTYIGKISNAELSKILSIMQAFLK